MRGGVVRGSAMLAAGGAVLLALHAGFLVPVSARTADLQTWPSAGFRLLAPPVGMKAPAAPVAGHVAARSTRIPTTPAIGSYQQVLINRDRAGARLGPLTWSSCLLAVARSNAQRMARQGYISHTNGAWLDLDCKLGAQGGENVGWWSGGVNDAQLNSMFMASPDHRANIMGPYHYVATAWAVGANGYAYIAVEFT